LTKTQKVAFKLTFEKKITDTDCRVLENLSDSAHPCNTAPLWLNESKSRQDTSCESKTDNESESESETENRCHNVVSVRHSTHGNKTHTSATTTV